MDGDGEFAEGTVRLWHDESAGIHVTETETTELMAELAELAPHRVTPLPARPAPAGARSAEAWEAAAILIRMRTSPTLVRSLVGLLRDWLWRRNSGSIPLPPPRSSATRTVSRDAPWCSRRSSPRPWWSRCARARVTWTSTGASAPRPSGYMPLRPAGTATSIRARHAPWTKAAEDHSMGPAVKRQPVRRSVITASRRPAAVRAETEEIHPSSRTTLWNGSSAAVVSIRRASRHVPRQTGRAHSPTPEEPEKTAGQSPFTTGSRIAAHSTCDVIGKMSA